MESFINSVDSQMHQKQEQQKLAAISARVESYEAVEGASEEVERVRTAYSTNNPLSSLQNKKRHIIAVQYYGLHRNAFS